VPGGKMPRPLNTLSARRRDERMRSRWKTANFLASAAIAALVARRYWEVGAGLEILWLVPILSLIWFYDLWSDWILGWLVAGGDAENSPPWIVALAGWLMLLGLAILAAYELK
jgi:hypothetical protein